MSLTLLGQKSLILLNKYHCRSSDRPGGVIDLFSFPCHHRHSSQIPHLYEQQ